jgi:predicted amidohydrolase
LKNLDQQAVIDTKTSLYGNNTTHTNASAQRALFTKIIVMIKISTIQFTPGFGTKQHNMQGILKLMQDLEADIVVLPELCTTGYSFLTKEEAFKEAEDLHGETGLFFKTLSEKIRAVIIAGFAEKEGCELYNSALVALPDGELRCYRKTHLFFKEKVCFSDGNSGFFITKHPYKDCNIGVMVCNDWRYPEAARSLALLGADIIACPCNLVSNLWGVAMPARALENKVYLAVANRCGTEIRELEDGDNQSLTFNGGSVLYDYNGTILAQAGKEKDCVLHCSIDTLQTRDKAFNAYNNLFEDRRPALYYS